MSRESLQHCGMASTVIAMLGHADRDTLKPFWILLRYTAQDCAESKALATLRPRRAGFHRAASQSKAHKTV